MAWWDSTPDEVTPYSVETGDNRSDSEDPYYIANYQINKMLQCLEGPLYSAIDAGKKFVLTGTFAALLSFVDVPVAVGLAVKAAFSTLLDALSSDNTSAQDIAIDGFINTLENFAPGAIDYGVKKLIKNALVRYGVKAALNQIVTKVIAPFIRYNLNKACATAKRSDYYDWKCG